MVDKYGEKFCCKLNHRLGEDKDGKKICEFNPQCPPRSDDECISKGTVFVSCSPEEFCMKDPRLISGMITYMAGKSCLKKKEGDFGYIPEYTVMAPGVEVCGEVVSVDKTKSEVTVKVIPAGKEIASSSEKDDTNKEAAKKTEGESDTLALPYDEITITAQLKAKYECTGDSK